MSGHRRRLGFIHRYKVLQAYKIDEKFSVHRLREMYETVPCEVLDELSDSKS